MIPQYRPLFDRPSIAKALSEYALGDGFFTEYKLTEKFEFMISDILNVKHCVVVNNGTISLSLALLSYGVCPGDEVIVPNITMIATCNAVKLIGAKPIFIDVDLNNGCLDLNKTKDYINTYHPKGIIYVTLNGRSHSIEEIKDFEDFCFNNHVSIIYDNAQSFGSETSWGQPINCFGTVGSFSFSMPKIITTGQGGCLVTNDTTKYEYICRLKDFGRAMGGIDIHNQFGINSKFTELQAIVGIDQLKNIRHRIDKKKSIYKSYKDKLDEVLFMKTESHVVPWFVDIYISRKQELKKHLNDNDIGCRFIYPELTTQKANFKFPYSLPNSELLSKTGMWLPSSLDLTEEEIKFICDKIKEFYNAH